MGDNDKGGGGRGQKSQKMGDVIFRQPLYIFVCNCLKTFVLKQKFIIIIAIRHSTDNTKIPMLDALFLLHFCH